MNKVCEDPEGFWRHFAPKSGHDKYGRFQARLAVAICGHSVQKSSHVGTMYRNPAISLTGIQHK
eukprot:960774-Pelagomonas_calceolata.AAC.3